MLIKDKKIQIYYPLTIPGKPARNAKCYIYSEKQYNEGGLWAHVRDLSQTETMTANAIDLKTTIQFTINYNPKIMKAMTMSDRIIIEYRPTGETEYLSYLLQGEPDRYEYGINDYKLRAERRTPIDYFDSVVFDDD